MTYRLIDNELWADEWVGDLDPESKLLWLCLLTNDKTNISGLYRITPKILADLTGIDRAKVEQIMARFDGQGKAHYRDGWVFVVNYQEYQMRRAGEKITAHIAKHLATVPDGYLKDLYLYRYPIDTLSMRNDEIGNRKEEKGKGKGGKKESAPDAQPAQAETPAASSQPPFSALNVTPGAAFRHEREQKILSDYENRTGDYIRNNERARNWLLELVGRYGEETVMNGALDFAAMHRAEHGGPLKALDFYLRKQTRPVDTRPSFAEILGLDPNEPITL